MESPVIDSAIVKQEKEILKKLLKDNIPKETLAKRQASRKVTKLIASFMKKYFELEENDESGHEENEKELIEGLYDIYDPIELDKHELIDLTESV
jgi:hypothetical protein